MPLRRLSHLVLGLPSGGNVDFARRGTAALWTVDNELAAVTAELLSGLIRITVQAHSKRGASLPDVLRVPRPSDVDAAAAAPRMATPEELAAFARATGGTVRPVGRKPSSRE